MSTEALPPPRRRNRLGLYLPIGLLLLLALAWSGGWLFIRDRVTSGLDEWVSREAAEGRRWSCADRKVGGYPFRIEVRCSDFTLDRPDVTASIGKLLVVAQVYRPRHIIAEASGPLRLKAGTTEADGRWKLLQASVQVADGKGFDLISVVADEPVVALHDAGGIPVDLSSRRFEGHLRPKPEDRSAIDISARSDGAVIPALNELIGGKEPADTLIALTITQTDDLPARPLWSELERWRVAGGIATLTSLKVVKGAQRLEGTGQIAIDAQHRPQGQLDLSAAGLGGLLGQFTSGAGGLLGALLGGGRAPEQAAPNAPLKRLPPLRLQNGRLLIGPLPVPGLRIPSLY